MKKVRLMLPLFAVTLGACSTYTPMVNDDQSATLGQKASGKPQAEKPLTALAVEPTTRITNGVSEDQAAYLMGKSLLSERRTDEAIDSFAKALSINPKMVDAYVGIGIAQSMANRQALAIAAFDEAVRLEPGSAQWRANLGMAFARNGDFQRANIELSKAWAMAPSNKRIEAQYERVAETARLERIVAEQATARQAQIDASGMTVITGNEVGNGMRRVSKRVYELDLEPKLAQPATTKPMSRPLVASMQTSPSASLPPLVSAEPVDAMAVAKVEEPTSVVTIAEKLPAPMLPPAPQMATVTETVATDRVATTTPVNIQPIAASAEQVKITGMLEKKPVELAAIDSTMQASMVGAAAMANTEQMAEQMTEIKINDESAMPMTLSAEQVAKAEAEIARKEQPAFVPSMPTTKEQMAVEMPAAKAQASELQAAPEKVLLSREEALELARQRLFERKLERARIRAARTAMIGLEDQAESKVK